MKQTDYAGLGHFQNYCKDFDKLPVKKEAIIQTLNQVYIKAPK
jgi:hypothetical protein